MPAPDASKPKKTVDDLEYEELELKVEDLRLRVRRPWWKRLEIPWVIAVATLLFQVIDGNRKLELEERKLTAERAKGESEASGFKTSLEAVTTGLARLEARAAASSPSAPPTSLRSEIESQIEREAQENIRWVLERDARARQVYDQVKSRNGGDKFGAVLAAQDHNPRAKQVITQYGKDKAVAFIESLNG